MKLPSLKVGDKVAKLPIIQGGMGVGVSRGNLAGSVMKAGGIGIISTAQIGYDEPDFLTDVQSANVRGLKKAIARAREICSNGILGINAMCAVSDYELMIKTAIEDGIDLIVSGAGLPKELPAIVEGTKVKIAPIISSARAAALIMKHWLKKHNRVPDMVIVEGPEAGGHLGFSVDDLENYGQERPDLHKIVPEVIEEVKKIEEQTGKKIPVIAAGGVFDGKDIVDFLKLGAAGVQIASRFVATYECDADIKFKEAYVNAKESDIKIVKSPVGMPGRAINNEFIQRVEREPMKIDRCYRCLKTCDPTKIPYCITKALINAVTGNLKEALIFCGSNVGRINKIVSVQELMDELVMEAEACLD